MTAVATPAVNPREVPDGVRVLLRGVSWDTYERLLAEHLESAGPRFTYDDGFLEIMTLSIEHEDSNRTLAALAEIILAEREMDFRRAGSNTFTRADLAKGFEPDSCFYTRHAAAVRGKRRLNLAVDPPPDLVIEIEVTAPILERLPIFAAVGVPEVWQYDGTVLRIWILESGSYREADESAVLPRLTSETIAAFMEQGREMHGSAWVRGVREWAQAHRP